MSRKATLGELMGKSGAKHGKKNLSMDHLPDLLGEAMPEMPINSVGRFRLINALRNRFGNGWRNIPGVRDIIKDFDSKVELEERIHKIKQVKLKGGKK